MPDPLNAQRYNHLAMWFHWSIALLILFNLAVGFFMEDWQQPLKGRIIGLHVSFGVSVAGLALLRLLWRLTHRPPAFSADLKPWEVRLAHWAHGLLYVLMFALPLTGWVFISCHPPSPRSGLHVFNLFTVPALPHYQLLPEPRQTEMHDLFVEYHEIAAWALIGLLVLHVAGALKHQFIDGHRELQRMGIGRMR